MRKGLLSILVIISIIALAAPTKKQLTLLKNDVVTIKSNIKKGNDLEKSEAMVRTYLADSVYSKETFNLQLLLCDVLKKAYAVGNEKMYLKQEADTACLVKTGKRMFLAYEQLDSLDAQPNERGVSSPSYRKRNAEFLLPYRTNVFMGGLYFLHKKEWAEAWEGFDIYLQCPYRPLFSWMHLPVDDATTYRVAFLSLEAARRLGNYDYARKYAAKAVLSHRRELALQILADMSLSHGDSTACEQYLRAGFDEFRKSEYFFPHLIDFYSSHKEYDAALAVCDTALRADSLNATFLLGKHTTLMQQQRYSEALVYGDKAIAQNDSLDTPYYNIGYVYHLRAQKAMKQHGKPFRQRMREAQKCYRRCLPYMERYRALRPDDVKSWRPILYDVYLNLNMGKEFSEIENL